MGINLRDVIAGLAAGADTEGSLLLNRRAKNEDADRALKQLIASAGAKGEPGSNISVVNGEDEHGPGIFLVDKVKQTSTRLGGPSGGTSTATPAGYGSSPADRALATLSGGPAAAPAPTSPDSSPLPAPPPTTSSGGIRPISKVPPIPKAPARTLVRNKDNLMVSVDPATGLDATGKPVQGYVPPAQPGVIAVQQDDGHGGVRTVLAPKTVGTVVPGPNTKTPAAIQKAIADNRQQLALIDDAVRELNAHPDAVGGKRALGDVVPLLGGVSDYLNQRVDSGGVAARAQLANMSSMVIKDRSGAAVTVSEFPRLAPFVPRVGDTPTTIRTKLAKLRQGIETETKLLEQGGGTPLPGTSSGKPPASSDPEFDALMAKYTTGKPPV